MKMSACLAACFAAAFVPSLWAAAPRTLTTEHLRDPQGLDEPRPRLSWQAPVPEGGWFSAPPRGTRQTAYRILVASDPALLAKETGDLWDSGRVASDASVLIDYAGRPLASRTICWWKVMTWDQRGRASDWSGPATWSMGLLEPGDWSAKWIASPTADLVEPAPVFRKAFAVTKPVRRATLYVCGLGFHEVRLNGAKMGDHEFDPKYTRYDLRALYVTHDVTAQLRRGTNAVGVTLGNGWYNYHIKNAWDFDTAPWRAKPRVLLQLEVDFADGSRQTVATDESWKFTMGPVRWDGLLGGETCDARAELPGWDTPAYDDTKWARPAVVEGPKGRLTAQMAHPIRIWQTFAPVRLTQPRPGVWVFDFGQNIAGFCALNVQGPAGTDVQLVHGELLHPDGTIDNSEIGKFCKSAPFQTDHYILKGQGTETWRPRFMYHGFQYVQVTGFPGTPTLESLRAHAICSDLPGAGAFACSSELINRIQRATWWSFANNFQGHPVDCPNRERNGWTGDAHLAVETGFYNFDPAANYTAWLRDMRDEQRASGELPGIVPTGGWGYQWGNGPAWDSAYLLIPVAQHLFTGDRRVLEEHYERHKRYVDYLTTKAKDGLVSIGLGDWCPPDKKTMAPVPVTSTAYYYKDACLVAESADLLGHKEDAEKYRALAASIRASFQRAFPALATGVGTGMNQTAFSAALYQGLVDPANVTAVVTRLVGEVAAKDNHLDCGILGTKYLLRALSDNGQAALAGTIVTQRTAPSWGCWMDQGATTLWEGWDGSGTHNHIMFGDVSAWCFAVLAGIRPDPSGPGFKKFIVQPEPVAGVTWAKAHHDSPYGRIESAWTTEAGVFRLDVTVPPNTTARIAIPTDASWRVTESGRTAWLSEGVTFIGSEPTKAIFEVVPGRYRFEVK